MSYSPSKHTTSNKSYGVQGIPDSARSYFYDDVTHFKYRPFQNTAEVLAYFDTAAKRKGQFSIIINSGGTLIDGEIIGGTNSEYWFQNGVEDSDLIIKFGTGVIASFELLTGQPGDNVALASELASKQDNLFGTGFVKISGSTISYDNSTYEPAFSKNTAFNKNFGTTADTVAEGNDPRILNGLTAYGWGDHAGLYSFIGHTHITDDITNLSSYTGFDARYYTQTQINNFFLGTTAISGYNKTNWDNAYTYSQVAHIPLSQKGAVNGVAPLGSDTKIPAIYLPSYVDDVLEFANLASFPVTGEADKIYVALDTNKTYRWSGTTYVEVSPSDVNSVNGQTGIVNLDASDVNAVPYTGATGNVDLGIYDLTADYLTANSDIITRNGNGHVFWDATNTYFTALYANGGGPSNYVITLPLANGTVALTSDIPSSSSYIQNQIASPQTAGFNISGTGIFGAGSLSATSIRGANQSANTGLYFSGSTGIAMAFSGSKIFEANLAGIGVTGTISSSALTTELVKSNSSGVLSNAIAGTDYLTPTGDGTGLNGVVLTTTNQTVGGMKTFSDAIQSSLAGGIFLSASSGNTNSYYAQIVSSVGNLQWGLASSISPFFTGGSNGAAVLGSSAFIPLEFGTSNITRYSISSGGNHDFKSGTATFGGALSGTSATFTGTLTAGLSTAQTPAYFSTNSVTNQPALTLFKNTFDTATDDVFRVQSYNSGAASATNIFRVQANGAGIFSNTVTTTSGSSAVALELRARSADDYAQINFTNNSGSIISGLIGMERTNAVTGAYDMYFFTKPGGGSVTSRLVISSTGNIGMSVGSPDQRLTVYNDLGVNGPILKLGRSAGAYTYSLGINASSNFFIYNNDGINALFGITPSGTWYYPVAGGSGNRLIISDNDGFLSTASIGPGLSFSGGVLSATGGSPGTITGSGTSGYLTKFTGSGAIGNSIMTESGSTILLNGTSATLRLGSNSSDYGTVTYSGGATQIYNEWAHINGYVRIRAYNSWWDFKGDGNLYSPGYISSNSGFYSSSIGTYMIPISTGWQLQSGSSSLSRWEFKTSDGVTRGFMGCNNTGVVGGIMNTAGTYVWYVDSTGYMTAGSGGTFSGTVTANSFSGAGTGLTGTASSLNIGGNAGSATLWGSKQFSFSTTGTVNSYILTYGVDGVVHVEDVNTVRSWLGLGSNAYSSTAYLPLSGGTLSGALAGTSASFSSSVTASGGFFNSDVRLKDIFSYSSDLFNLKSTAFTWKKGSKREDGNKIHYGYVAQEVEKYLPDAVTVGEDGYKSVNYAEVHTVKIQQLEDKIKKLEVLITKLGGAA